MDRFGSAHWQGSLTQGKGTVSTHSGVLNDTPYSFSSRFENGAGTNPEELLAAAHAGCFTMAFSAVLGANGFTPDDLKTAATVTVEKDGEGFTITKSHLVLEAVIPGIDEAKFRELAGIAEKTCPVSKLYKAEITLNATLKS